MIYPFVDAHTHEINQPENTVFLYNLKLDSLQRAQYCSAGIHPRFPERGSLHELRGLLREYHCCALGECGLDSLAPLPIEEQKELFLKQIELAAEFELPMIIHCVRLHYDIIHYRKQFWRNPRIPWIIHGFRGNEEIACAYLRAGCILSLSPVWIMHLDCWPGYLAAGTFLLETDEAEIPLCEVYRKCAELRVVPRETVKEEIYKTFSNIYLSDSPN